jgi:hypothetical protein
MSRVGEVVKPRGNVGLASLVATIAQSMAPRGPAKRAGAEMPNPRAICTIEKSAFCGTAFHLATATGYAGVSSGRFAGATRLLR